MVRELDEGGDGDEHDDDGDGEDDEDGDGEDRDGDGDGPEVRQRRKRMEMLNRVAEDALLGRVICSMIIHIQLIFCLSTSSRLID